MGPPPIALSYKDVDGDIGDKLDRLFQVKNSFIEVNPGKMLLPPQFKLIGQSILDLPVHEDDIWLCSFPRTGSTWAQEMVWLIGHDLDYEGAKQLQQMRCPLLELTSVMIQCHKDWHNESIKGTSVDLVRESLPKPRYVRSHLCWDLLPKELLTDDNRVKAKVIYTTRNPKDMCVSFYHYCGLVHNLKGTFEEFCELFLEAKTPLGSVWDHILGFWAHKDDPNVLILQYEDMKRDLPRNIHNAAKFLGKSLTDCEVSELAEHLSFDKMKNNRAVNLEPIIEKTTGAGYTDSSNGRFIRKGVVGDWKNHMTEETAKRFDEKAEKYFKGTGINYD